LGQEYKIDYGWVAWTGFGRLVGRYMRDGAGLGNGWESKVAGAGSVDYWRIRNCSFRQSFFFV